MNFILAQIIGSIGLLFLIISFQKDRRSFMLIVQLFSALLFAIHFSLLNAWTGAAMASLAGARSYFFNLRD